ncbi:right-handed parallel beta-helix repeat-containing protein [Halegenticoccus tardaugens]|uniref:right-handed parallel beta-helix repeat-containing protein n=1 Tax=Halegenticoccus tardaugens TaxID=2071624 RepID=UPI00100BEA94|nr:right-handed parallel beta-helix repeat-containing protein [Halegenticoccus tardaugens]
MAEYCVDGFLFDCVRMTRRKLLKVMGVVAGGSGITVGQRQSIENGDSHVEERMRALTQQYTRDHYTTAPKSGFDDSAMQAGELYWLTDDGEIGVKDENGGVIRPPMGSPNGPLPSINTERLYNAFERIVKPSMTTGEIQSAIDEVSNAGGGVIQFGPGTYNLSVQGQDADGEDYCLAMKSNVVLQGAGDQTVLFYDANSSVPDLASPILCSNVTDWEIRNLKVDAGVRAQTTERHDSMGIKVGARRGDGTTGCDRFRIDNVTVTGGFRHGIETSDGSTVGRIDNCLLDDASGDDDISISVNCRNVYVNECISINKRRAGDWTTDCFEIEDGATDCAFIDCVAIDPVAGGFQVGKTHGQTIATYGPCTDVWCDGCTVITPGRTGFTVGGFHQSVERIRLVDCEVRAASGVGILINAGAATLKDVTVADCRVYNGRDRGLQVRGGTVSDLSITDCVFDANHREVALSMERVATSANFEDLIIENCRFKNTANAGLKFENTATEYSGNSIVRNNYFKNNAFKDIVFATDANIRKYVRTLHNEAKNGADYSPVVPTNPENGTEYLDDGTNTETGARGKRIYNGTSWQDAWTM